MKAPSLPSRNRKLALPAEVEGVLEAGQRGHDYRGGDGQVPPAPAGLAPDPEQASRGLHGVANRGDPRAMPFDSGEFSSLRPAAVTIHDDGDVFGKPLQIDSLEKIRIN